MGEYVECCNSIFKIQPPKELSQKIIGILNGMPGQVYFAAELMASEGPDFIIRRFDEIKKYNDVRVFTLIEQIKAEGGDFLEMLIFISRIEFLSFHLIYKIFGRTTRIMEILEKLYLYGVYDYIGVDKEYIETHHAIVDYILRSKTSLSTETKQKLKTEVSDIIKNGSDYPDISEVLLTIKSLVDDDKPIPEKYLIPSFILRTIIDNYYAGHYEKVEKLADKILSHNGHYHGSIVREIRYWYCQSLVKRFTRVKKLSHDIFFANLREFEGTDYFFLLGFYQRHIGQMANAERSFREALRLDRYSQKSKRELVQVLLSQDKYAEALTMARDNYKRKPLNAFHIQAYFMCLARKFKLSETDKHELDDLLQSIKISHDPRANEILQCMEGEYFYYVENDLQRAVTCRQKRIEHKRFMNTGFNG